MPGSGAPPDSPNPENASPVAPPGITLELDAEPSTPDKGRPGTSARKMSGTPQDKDSPDRYAMRSTERERRRLVGDIGSARSRRAPSPSSVLPGRRRRNFSISLSGRLSSVERVRSNEDGDAKVRRTTRACSLRISRPDLSRSLAPGVPFAEWRRRVVFIRCAEADRVDRFCAEADP